MSADALDGADNVLQMFGDPGSLTEYGCGTALYDKKEVEIHRPTSPTRPQRTTHWTGFATPPARRSRRAYQPAFHPTPWGGAGKQCLRQFETSDPR